MNREFLMAPELSSPATPLIGRQSEMATITTYLQQPHGRLLTLTGPAGSGKTRLALHAAAELAVTFADGVIWCDLAPVTDAAYVPHVLAARLGLSEPGDQSLLDLLVESCHGRHLLLILDNCEHLLAAVSALVHHLRQRCPRLHVLLTSLYPTGLNGEKVWPLAPLALPEPTATLTAAQAAEFDAVRLFVERATAVLPGFALTEQNVTAVAAICQRLDGLPLAIELAAARVPLLPPADIAARLDDAFALLSRQSPGQLSRHQTLRGMMEWSFNLLSAAEQQVLRRLAVFTGPFSVEMAEAVLPEQPNLLNVLADLLDKSLLTAVSALTAVAAPPETPRRFRLLEVVRQYAREQLELAGETAVAQNHLLAWAVALAEQARPQLIGSQQALWLERLQSDYAAIRAALRWAATSHQPEPGLRLAAALFRFWFGRGALSEGRAWLEELLLLPGEVPETVRAWALFASGRLALRQWDVPHAARRGAESLAIFRAAADRPGIVQALSLMALVAQEQHDVAQAIACYDEALTVVRTLPDPYLHTVLLHNFGLLYHERGEYGRAESLYQEALQLTRQHRLPGLGTGGNLAEILALRGNYAAALELSQANLERSQRLQYWYTVAQENLTLGMIAYFQGETAVAAAHYQQARELHRQMGTTGGLAFALAGLGDVALVDGRPAEAQRHYDEALHLFTELDQAKGLALAHTGLGRLAAAAGQMESARTHLLAGWRQAERAGYPAAALTAVTELAALLAQTGDRLKAVGLWTAVQARRAALGIPTPPVEQPRLAAIAAMLPSFTADEPADWAQLVAEYVPTPTPPAVTEQLAVTALPEPAAHIYLMGPVQVVVAGRPLTAADWTYHKARELFFYLLAQPPSSKAQIGLALWPEASSEQLRNEFHRTLYHLRRAIGQPDWVQFNQGAYQVNPAANLWCDLHEFERLLAAVRPLRQTGGVAPTDGEQVIAALEKAASLWRGDFLADVMVGDWAITRGEALRQECLNALLALGQLYLAAATYEQAITAFRRVLALDSFLELAHRELMRCYGRRGERGQAMRHYQTLRQLLQDELGIAPSPETRLLYERLRRGDEV
ncbi:MAG: tetratricopeptide repeat protein [Anaerolineae bacterium]|nr:tetratricopeptide repeat protein [Anaerolineae bacterium]